MLKRKKTKNREEWLSCRYSGIGGSESAAVVGLSPWLTASELWMLKTGEKESSDLSTNEAVATGVRMEPVLRNLYKAMHPQYRVTYNQFDLLSQKERPWLFATLDGELYDKETKKHGVLEIKTSSPVGSKGWGEWNEQIPVWYRCQLSHQLLATGFDFAVLYACLFTRDRDFTIREYCFDRDDLKDDMAWLLEKETEFWDKIQKKELPGLTIVL